MKSQENVENETVHDCITEVRLLKTEFKRHLYSAILSAILHQVATKCLGLRYVSRRPPNQHIKHPKFISELFIVLLHGHSLPCHIN